MIEELSNVISLEGLSYDNDKYLDEEIDILQPRLEANGFMDIRWYSGESDSFGPLTRLVDCLDLHGQQRTFMYG